MNLYLSLCMNDQRRGSMIFFTGDDVARPFSSGCPASSRPHGKRFLIFPRKIFPEISIRASHSSPLSVFSTCAGRITGSPAV
ncbi:MAG: hypothetical protein CSB33_03890 [Desulfobacterales bacterium]|nr:MAG: hypothetical protein CSB33_03890 [Desulfobacterales bacterium]